MKNKKIIVLSIVIIIVLVLSGYFLTKNFQKQNREYEVEKISEYKYFVLKENDKYGVIDAQGNKIIECGYEDVKIPNPEKSVFVCYQSGNTVILNEKGEKIFTEYDNVEPLRLKNVLGDLMYEKSVLKYCKNGKYGIIDFTGRRITKAIYEDIDTLQYKEGELLVKKDGKYGVINIKGTTLVKTKYDTITVDKFYEEGTGYKKSGYIVSKTTDEGYRYGYVNLEGKEKVETKYNDLYRITDVSDNDVYNICAENGKYGLIKNGKKVIENEYQSLIYNKSNNTLSALKGKKYGVLSLDGKIIVPFEYLQIDVTGDYIYATSKDSVKVFDSNGEETNINSNLAIINVDNTNYKIHIETQDDKTIYNIYNSNYKITKEEYSYIQYLFGNYFIACKANGKLGVIDDKEQIKVEYNYDSIQQIDNTNMIEATNSITKNTEVYSNEIKKICELADAKIENEGEYLKLYNNNETKYITKDGKETTNKDILNNKIFAQNKNGKWGYIDGNDNVVVDFKYDKVTEVNQYGFAGIMKNNSWGIINKDGKIIVEPKYKVNSDNPVFIGEYYQVIYGNGEIYFTK